MIAPKSVALIIALALSSADASWDWGGNSDPSICSWSAGTSTDIYGTGMDAGTSKGYEASCKKHCQDTSGCQAAQFSTWQKYNGNNCFIYDSKNDNNPLATSMNDFKLYKCTRQKAASCQGQWCGPYYKDIDGTGLDGGSSQWSWSSCQSHCTQNGQCKAAQYSDDQDYNGNNCFIYDNQNPFNPQLKNFKLWYYNGHSSAWGNAQYRDIDGVGMGGSWENSLEECKTRCKNSNTCKTAQYSSTDQYQGSNCFIYETDVPNKPQFMNFLLYKYTRAGCQGWFCSRLYSAEDAKWVQQDKESNIMNLALPLLLPIAAVLAVVGVVRVVRVRLSQRAVVVPGEDSNALFVDTEMEVQD